MSVINYSEESHFDFIKFIAPAFTVWLLHGLLPLYVVFLSYAAFYQACAVLIDTMFVKKNITELRLDKKVYLVLATLVVLLGIFAFYAPSFSFLVAYLPFAIAALACFEFVRLVLDSNKHYDFCLISTVIAMTAVMFGSGLLVEANFLLSAVLISVVVFLSVFCKEILSEGKVKIVLEYFSFVFFNPISTVALVIVFGLSGFGFLPILALTKPVFAAICAVSIVGVSSMIYDKIDNYNKGSVNLLGDNLISREEQAQVSDDLIPVVYPLAEEAVSKNQVVQKTKECVEKGEDQAQVSDDLIPVAEEAVSKDQVVQKTKECVEKKEEQAQVSDDLIPVAEEAVSKDQVVQKTKECVEKGEEQAQLSDDLIPVVYPLAAEAVSKDQVVPKQKEPSWMSDDPVIDSQGTLIKKARGIAADVVYSNWDSATDSAPAGSHVGINGVRMFNAQLKVLCCVPFRYNFLHSAIFKVLQQGQDFQDLDAKSLLFSDGEGVNWCGDFAIKGLLTQLKANGLTLDKLAPNLKVRARATFKYNELLHLVKREAAKKSLGLLPSDSYRLVAEYAYDGFELESKSLLKDLEASHVLDSAACDRKELILKGRVQ